jgi:hypothetical protein
VGLHIESSSAKLGRGKRVGGDLKYLNITDKEGEKFRDKKTGKIYIVKNVYRGEVLLQGENGLGRRYTSLRNLEVTFDRLEDKVLKE